MGRRRLMGVAFGDFYPRYTVAASIILSIIGGLLFGVTSLLYLGPVDNLSPVTLLEGLHSPVSVAAFSGGMFVWTGIVAWSIFGRNAPEDLTSEYPHVGQPSRYIGVMLIPVLYVVFYYAVTFLNSLASSLGLIITGTSFLYRIDSSNVWVTIGNTPRQNTWITRLVLSAVLVVGVAAYVLGIVPTFTYEE